MVRFIKQNWIILLILAISAVLRFVDLGRQSYWYDETWVATAAVQPTLAQAVKIARLNIAAPPLDYVITWAMGQVSLQEGWLRIPEALWGVGAVWAIFFLARKMFGDAAALTAAALVALAPIHIYFSQELRFYSPWFFFYWLLSSLLYQAASTPTRRNWILVVEVASIGAYFHFYTVLAFLNGFAFLLTLSHQNRQHLLSAWKGYLIAGIVTGLLVLPGFLVFGLSGGKVITFPGDLNQLANAILSALELVPLNSTPSGAALSVLLSLLAGAGLLIAIFRRNWVLIGLVSSIALQISLIAGLDIFFKYLMAPRQFFAFLPITFFLASYALDTLAFSSQALFRRLNQSITNLGSINRVIAGTILGGLIIVSFIASLENRQFEKSNARVLSEFFHQNWQAGDLVWVNPSWEGQVYMFYLEEFFYDNRISDSIIGYDYKDLPVPGRSGNHIYLIAPPPSPEQSNAIAARGFKLIRNPEGPRWVWLYSGKDQ
jgi:hypothetical protein